MEYSKSASPYFLLLLFLILGLPVLNYHALKTQQVDIAIQEKNTQDKPSAIVQIECTEESPTLLLLTTSN